MFPFFRRREVGGGQVVVVHLSVVTCLLFPLRFLSSFQLSTSVASWVSVDLSPSSICVGTGTVSQTRSSTKRAKQHCRHRQASWRAPGPGIQHGPEFCNFFDNAASRVKDSHLFPMPANHGVLLCCSCQPGTDGSAF